MQNQNLAQPLAEALTSILMNKEGDRELGYNEFRCSEVWHCPRRLALKRLYPDEKIEPDAKAKGIFLWGNCGHSYLQTELPMRNPEFHSPEFLINRDFGSFYVSGHVDIFFGEHNIIEIKTINPYAMGHILEKEEPQSHHVEQVNFMCGFFHPYKTPTLLYMSKEINSKSPNIFYPIFLKYDNLMFNQTVEKLHIVIAVINGDKSLYNLPATTRKWECNYCEMRDICKEKGLRPQKITIGKI